MRFVFLFCTCFFQFSFLVAQIKPCDTPSVQSKTDTTIVLKYGTTLTFNRCDFFDVKDCIEMYEVRNLADLKETALTTQDVNGEALLTCGMFVLKLNSSNDCDNKECVDNPIRVRIPVLQNKCMGNITTPNQLYRIKDGAAWEAVDGSKEVIGNDGKKYLEFYTTCGGKFNCDQRLTTFKVKFKARKLKKISSFNVAANCPLLNLNFSSKNRKDIIMAKLPCLNPDSLMIKIEGINSFGEKQIIEKPLSHFTSKYTKSKCVEISKNIKRRILGIFPLRERNIYKKYIID